MVSELKKPAESMDQAEIQTLVAPEMEAVDTEISARLSSEVALIGELGAYIINSGGKRLRPNVALLASLACHYQGQQHVLMATIIEFIHTATLLHDDVVDSSEMRRGESSANAVWGNSASVLVGDFLYSRAFEMMVELDDMRIMQILAKTTNTIAEGEVMQLMNCHNPDTSEARYIHVIHSKTAKLFQAATQLGAVIAKQPDDVEKGLADYGMHLGTAFQLIDDVLDYSQDSGVLGKNVGDDLAEGKPTLPLIHAMQNGGPEQKELLRAAIKTGGLEQIDDVVAALKETGSITYTAKQAEREAELAVQALAPVPESQYKQALMDLALLSVHRSF